MTQPYVHGAVHLFVNYAGTSPVYLGTGERAPRYSLRRHWEKVMNDIAGVVIPFDYSYQGEEAFVTVKLTRWAELVLAIVQDPVGAGFSAPNRGFIAAGQTGSLMLTEGLAPSLWIQYNYGPGSPLAHAAMVAGGMPAGYHFPACWAEGPDDTEGGTDPASVLLTFHAARVYNPATQAFTLFDSNMAGLPLPN